MRGSVVSLLLIGIALASSIRTAEAGDPRPARDDVLKKARAATADARYQNEIETPKFTPPSSGWAIPAGFAMVMAYILIMLALALVLWAVVTALLWARRQAPLSAESGPGPKPEVDLSDEAGARALEEADLLASGRAYLDAVRRLFLEAAGRIERARQIPLARAETNEEYLSKLRPARSLHEVMGVLASVIDSSYYGGRACEEADWVRCRDSWRNAVEASAA
jgi:Arc/MetJ family transcription regulator